MVVDSVDECGSGLGLALTPNTKEFSSRLEKCIFCCLVSVLLVCTLHTALTLTNFQLQHDNHSHVFAVGEIVTKELLAVN